MSDKDLATRLWEGVKGWVNNNADHYVYAHIPKERTDREFDDSPLKAEASYFRLWLAEMFMRDSRKWFVDWWPAVHSSVQLKFGDQDKVNLSHVAQAPDGALAKSVLLGFPVTELVPFRGGVVEIESALIGLKGKNHLSAAIGVLQSFSGLIGAPLGQVLTVADKVSSGMQELFGAANGQVVLGLHQAFTSAGAGGNALRPGYFAVILATTRDLDAADLTVKEDRLLHKGRPLDGFDYMLYRVEGRVERDDWRLKNIQEPLDKAIEASLLGEDAKANNYKVVAMTAAMQSPDLAVHDRRRVALAIKEELEAIGGLGLGAVGGEVRDMDAIMGARAMSVAQAQAEGELSFDELI
jgi:hypothetical protein